MSYDSVTVNEMTNAHSWGVIEKFSLSFDMRLSESEAEMNRSGVKVKAFNLLREEKIEARKDFDN